MLIINTDANISCCQKNSFQALPKKKQTLYTELLTKNKKKKSSLMHKFYDLNIDFLNKKITKKDYLKRMSGLAEAIHRRKTKTDEGEKYIVNSFRMFFDMNGCNPNAIRTKNIIDSFEYLI